MGMIGLFGSDLKGAFFVGQIAKPCVFVSIKTHVQDGSSSTIKRKRYRKKKNAFLFLDLTS